MGEQIIGSWGDARHFHGMAATILRNVFIPFKEYFQWRTYYFPLLYYLPIERLQIVTIAVISFAIVAAVIRHFVWHNRQETERLGRRRSSSFNEHEVFPRRRNRSLSNDSWLKQSSRNRLWSNSVHRMSFHRQNSVFLLDESRRHGSVERQSSMDVVRDSDEQLDADEFFLRALEDEEVEERRQQLFRERSNSKNSTGSKGNKEVPLLPPAKSYFCLLGPSVTTIEFSTVAPPPSWSKASRNLVLSDQTWDLSRVLILELLSAPTVVSSPDFGNATLIIQKTKSNILKPNQSHKPDKFVLKASVSDCSVHVHGSPECGVLDIYEKGAERSEWIEQTFVTAAEAAQFQMDLLALQILGPLIYNMYVALRIIHQGSDVFTGTEPLLHHVSRYCVDPSQEATADDGKVVMDRSMFVEESGIAWDDVMRSLGSSFPSIRIRLEAMRWLEVYGSFSGFSSEKKEKRGVSMSDEAKGSELTSEISVIEQEDQPSYAMIKSMYSKRRRILLGPVDFFRLFVPKLPETALPEADCSRLRMERMLRWRKRVARAAVLIQNYCRARTVVNLGWKIAREVKIHDTYWKRRFAFDDNIDNHRHDISATNEYYEATVSRDVNCQVRGLSFLGAPYRSRFFKVKEHTATSLYQAYSLVGIHSFQWFSDDDGSPLHPKMDPVQSIASLRKLISSNPLLDFFVVAIFLPSKSTVIVHAYVRSLAKGIDPKFDNNIQRFIESGETVRRKKLEVSVQLEIDKDGLSFPERCILIFLSLLLRFTVRRRIQTPNPFSMNDRTPLPSLNLSECGDTSHFGGVLQNDDTLPKNYVAATAYLHSRQNCNLVTRMMLSYIELGGLSRNVADITFILAGEFENELPERALCTSRTVCSSLTRLPKSCVSLNDNAGILVVDSSTPDTEDKGIASLMLKMFVTDPFVATFESIIRSVAGIKSAQMRLSPSQVLVPDFTRSPFVAEQDSVNNLALDPFQRAINELISILDGISFPVTPNVSNKNISNDDSRNRMKQVEQMAVLNAFDRSDIVRYFIASNCNLKAASVRIVESAIWRGSTFPIDTRTCRIELQTGQFFQQGFDLGGNPVFYFRNYCLGPWRKDPEAVIAAVLYRLERSLSQLSQTNPFVQCTLIVLAGRPYRSKGKSNKDLDAPNASSSSTKDVKDDRHDQSTIASTAVSTLPGTDAEEQSNDDGATVVMEHDVGSGEAIHTSISNPRVFSDELWNMHTSKDTIAKLVNVLQTHYPERLGTALVVIGHGNKKYARSVVGSMIYLAGLINSARTRDKVRFLTRYRDLQSFVHRSELITLAGGTQVVNPRHFECD